MAKGQKTARKEAPPEDNDLPEGFEPISGKMVLGWFICEEGNTVQGYLRDKIEVKSQFGDGKKTVYKIQISSGETRIMHPENGETTATEGDLIGLDERGFLKRLADIEKGREVFVKCKGKLAPSKKFPRGAWEFSLGAVPF